jgi:hypothetical protein
MSKFAFIDLEIWLTMELHRKPLADAKPPIKRQIWLDYDTYTLPSHEICSALE